jgi:enoyl-CoA hydratase/carnithine racemase
MRKYEFGDYAERYESLRMTRDDNGVLVLTLHSEGKSLNWDHPCRPSEEFAYAFADIARDPDNRVVVMIGTGENWSEPSAQLERRPRPTAGQWDVNLRNGTLLTDSLLQIGAITISCVNGPVLRHVEIPLLADVVLAAPEATFQDTAHFPNRTVPGDGINFILPLLVGFNRARYLLLTGAALDAVQAHALGLVAEILPRERLLERARELAKGFAQQNPLALRYTRQLFMQEIRARSTALSGLGLALEGLAAIHEAQTSS